MADPNPDTSRHGSMQTQPGSASTAGSTNINRASAPSISVSHSSSQSSESRRNKTRQIIQEIEKVRARKVPRRRKSFFGLRQNDRRIRPTPPVLSRYAEDQYQIGRIPRLTEQHLRTITRADDPRGPTGLGTHSLVVELLKTDAARENGQKHLVWTELQNLAINGLDHIKFYEISSPDGGPALRVVLKTQASDLKTGDFFKDYDAEAEFTRRLNMAGCNEVINVIDWCTVGWAQRPVFKICYEYAAHNDLWDIMDWYTQNTLILPEAFIWHIFRCIASALAFCNHGTNSGRRIPGWDTIIHGDLKDDNIFLFAPDETENRLYPFAKLADLGMTITEPAAQYRQGWPGTQGWFPPEQYYKMFYNGIWRYPEPTEPSPASDIWTLGLIIRRLISLINKFVPEDSAQELIRRGHKRPFYSPALNRLVEACMEEKPSKRPKAHEVYEMASHFHEIHRRKLYKREEYSRQQGSPVYLGKVIFTDEERFQYEVDESFREQYQEANCGPLRDWLGIPPAAWRRLDPDKKYKGPREGDLLISAPAFHDPNVQQNTRLVLQDDRSKRWYAEYFEAAGALLPPPQKPESLPTPNSATIRVINANWQNVPKARQQSISEGSSWFALPKSPPDWFGPDYERGEVFVQKPSANASPSPGGDHSRPDDDDNNNNNNNNDDNNGGGDNGNRNGHSGGNVNTTSHAGDQNAEGGGSVEGPSNTLPSTTDPLNLSPLPGAFNTHQLPIPQGHSQPNPITPHSNFTVTNPTVPEPTVPNSTLPNPIVPNPTVPNPIVPNPTVPNPIVPNPNNHPPPSPTTNQGHEKRARFASNVATQVARGVEVLSKLDGTKDGSQWRGERKTGRRSERRGSRIDSGRRSSGRSEREAGEEGEGAAGGEDGGQEEDGRGEEANNRWKDWGLDEEEGEGEEGQEGGQDEDSRWKDWGLDEDEEEEGQEAGRGEERAVSEKHIEMKW